MHQKLASDGVIHSENVTVGAYSINRQRRSLKDDMGGKTGGDILLLLRARRDGAAASLEATLRVDARAPDSAPYRERTRETGLLVAFIKISYYKIRNKAQVRPCTATAGNDSHFLFTQPSALLVSRALAIFHKVTPPCRATLSCRTAKPFNEMPMWTSCRGTVVCQLSGGGKTFASGTQGRGSVANGCWDSGREPQPLLSRDDCHCASRRIAPQHGLSPPTYRSRCDTQRQWSAIQGSRRITPLKRTVETMNEEMQGPEA